METNERFRRIASASSSTLERIDQILEGQEDNLRTITLKDAAKRLGVSRPTVYRMVRDGALTTVLIGGLERIPVRALVDYATRPARPRVMTAV